MENPPKPDGQNAGTEPGPNAPAETTTTPAPPPMNLALLAAGGKFEAPRVELPPPLPRERQQSVQDSEPTSPSILTDGADSAPLVSDGETHAGEESPADTDEERESEEANEATAVREYPASATPLEDIESLFSEDEPLVEPPPMEEDVDVFSTVDDLEELVRLAAASAEARLAPADEEKLTRLTKESMRNGVVAMATVVKVLPTMPWILGVRAVEAVWADLTVPFRRQLLSGLSREKSEGSLRVRLSLSRGLAKLDPVVSAKLAAHACGELLNTESGTLDGKRAALIGSVFIGRGKPWVVNLQTGSLTAEENGAIVFTVLGSAFSQNNPPLTQLTLLSWAGKAGLLGSLPEPLFAAIAKTVGKWSGKWQQSLRREVPSLPENLLALLTKEDFKADGGTGKKSAGRRRRGERAVESGGMDAEGEAAAPAEIEPDGETAVDRERDDDDEMDDRDDEDDERDDEDEGEESEAGDDRGARKKRPPYIPRDQAHVRDRESSGSVPRLPANFNPGDALRNLEAYVQQSRSQLQAAETKIRRLEEEVRRLKRSDRPMSVEEENLTSDELRRLNIQLDFRILELQARVAELTADSELRAAVSGMMGDEAVEPLVRFQKLLAMKLHDDYHDFLALEKEAPDMVVQQHYREIARDMIKVLLEEGVVFEAETAATTQGVES